MEFQVVIFTVTRINTAQKKFSFKYFFIKCDQILRIW